MAKEKVRLFDNRIPVIEQPVTLEEAAKFLHKSPETIRRYCRLNNMPYIPSGNSYQFFLSSVTTWLKDQERNSVHGN